MDSAKVTGPPKEQDWDADDFEIPSLKVEKQISPREELTGGKKGTFRKGKTETENIYLGPHGAPPSQLKQHELNANGKKNRRKQKLKEADRKLVLAGRENKVEVLRDLMGSKGSFPTPMGPRSEWLDPHCQESQFDRSS